MKLSCAVIHDESLNPNFINDFILSHPQLQLQHIQNHQVVLTKAEYQYIDLVFLSLNQPVNTLTGHIQSLQDTEAEVVLISENLHFAFTAYNLGVIDFLSADTTRKRFDQCVSKVKRWIRKAEKLHLPQASYFFMEDHKHRKVKLRYEEIVLVETYAKELTIYTKEDKFSFSFTLKVMEGLLLRYSNFIKVNRSTLISKNHIRHIDNGQVQMSIDHSKIPLGEKYIKNFHEFIEQTTPIKRRWYRKGV